MNKTEGRLVRMGGLSGILVGLVFYPSWDRFYSIPASFGRAGGPEGALGMVAGYNTLFVVAGDVLFLSSLLLILFYIALYRVLREASPGYSLLGVVLGVLASAAIAIFVSVTSSAFLGLAEIRSRTPITEPTAVVTITEASFGLFEGFLHAESRLRAAAFILFGMAIAKSTSFKKWYGWLSVVFGILFLASSLSSRFVNFTYFYIVFNAIEILFAAWLILLGLKIYRLSKPPHTK